MKKKFQIDINKSWCKSCQICVDFCPKNVLEMDNFYAAAVRPEECTGCKICERLCPDFAITINQIEKEKTKA